MVDWRKILFIVIIVLLVYITIVATLGLLTDKAIFGGRYLKSAKLKGIFRQDKFIQGQSGALIHTRILHGAQNGKEPLAILYCHGNGGSVNSWSKDAKYLTNYGDVFLFDFSGFGYTSGKPSQEKVLNDSIQAYRHLTNEYGNNIIVWGRSLGAPLASHIAVHFKPKMVMLEVPLTDMAHIVRHKIFLPGISLFVKNRFNLQEQLKKLKSSNDKTKLICIAAKNDFVIPLKHVIQLKQYFDEFYVLPGGHRSILNHSEYYATVDYIFKQIQQ